MYTCFVTDFSCNFEYQYLYCLKLKLLQCVHNFCKNIILFFYKIIGF